MEIREVTGMIEEGLKNDDSYTGCSTTDTTHLLLYKLLVEGRTKVEAIHETVEALGASVTVMIDTLKRADALIMRKYGDKVYHMICLSQTQWVINRVNCMELIEAGFKLQKGLKDGAAYDICVEGEITAKLFEHEADALKFLYGSELVAPLPIRFQKASSIALEAANHA